MWRQLLDMRAAAWAYLACLNADEVLVKGQIFNVSYRNVRIRTGAPGSVGAAGGRRSGGDPQRVRAIEASGATAFGR